MVKRAVLISPNNPQYYHELGQFYIAQAGEVAQDLDLERLAFYKSAIDNFQKSVTLNPVNSITQFHVASSKFKVAGNLLELAYAVTRIKKIDPQNRFTAN